MIDISIWGLLAALAYSTSIKHKIKDHLTTIGVHSLIDD